MRVVLLVEPNLETRTTIQEMLESAGVRVISAGHGAEAFLKLKDSIVPTAVMMCAKATMMSGDGFLPVFRAHPQFQNVPVIQVKKSGESDLTDVSGVVESPYELSKILALLKKLLE
jgi:CheY-like chemotaxis protein